MDATETALLAGVAAAADDAPRLVYADWLDETGRPAQAAQAEFIRRQCHDDPVCTWRQRELLRTYGRDWLRPLAEVMGLTDWGWNGGRAQLWGQRIPIGWEFSRGFPDEVTCPLGWWTGSYCPECGPARSAWQEVYYPLEPCRHCQNVGHALGVGPAVVRAAPFLCRVRTEKRPLLMEDEALPVRWYCRLHMSGRNVDRLDPGSLYALPRGVWDCLAGAVLVDQHGDVQDVKAYAGPTAAAAGLEAALVAWAWAA